MMKNWKQKTLRFLKYFGLFLALSIGAAFVFRDALLQKAIAKIQNKLEVDYDCQLTLKKASFVGISEIDFETISLVPKNADTLFSIEKIKTKIAIFPLLAANIQLNSLVVENGFIQLIKNKKGRNYDAFLQNNSEEKTTNEKRNYAKSTYRLLSKILNLIPPDMHLQNLDLRINDKGRKVSLQMTRLELEKELLQTEIFVKTNTFEQNWNINGFANPREKKANLTFSNSDKSQIKVPYLDERFDLISSFDNIRIAISKIELESGELHIDGFTSISNFKINNPKIAQKDVVFNKAKFDYRFVFGSDFMAIDSSSTIQINDIAIHPFAEYNTEEDTIYKLQLRIPKMKAQLFINSLPGGLFSHFEGMKATGNFDYKLIYKYNKNKPITLVFDSKLHKENLKITQYGEANLGKLNQDFTYRAIENGVSQRPILVGTENPDFTPLNAISPYLQKCVLTSEDPSFFSHHGFINEAFKQSILKNIRTKKFSRGASTISMQLIKNVFLTREKTISRKLEEILLVYLLENNRIASKERMLEVYFNIIEWGPNVYGIGEASRFYFNKTPADLNLKECLFLASIVPKPKKFMWQFDADGLQKAFANKHQDFIRNLMFRRGLLTSEDTIGQKIPMQISGLARSLLKKNPQDSIAIDSLFIAEPEGF